MYSVSKTFVRLSTRVPGVLYRPEGGSPRERIAVLVMHSDEDYLDCPTGQQLAMRGFVVLCANVMVKEGVFFHQSQKLEAVKAAVEYLRSLPETERVILMGHSGGATLMTAYQCIAENGVGILQGPEKILPHPDCAPLPPADGLMLFDPNWGNAAMQLFSLDPAVADEGSGRVLEPDLNLFDPRNGFDPRGSTFPDTFIRRFQQAQGARNGRILNHALERLAAIERGDGLYEDDEPLVIPGADQGFLNNKLYAQDVRLMSRTKRPHKLLYADGSVTEEIIRSLRGPENPVCLTGSLCAGGRIMTVKNYLSSYAVRTTAEYGYGEDGVWGIDWGSSYSCPVGNVADIRVPLLVVGMTGGWEFLASETIFDHAASEDKTLAFVEGADHKFNPISGRYGDTMSLLHDYAADWLTGQTRF